MKYAVMLVSFLIGSMVGGVAVDAYERHAKGCWPVVTERSYSGWKMETVK